MRRERQTLAEYRRLARRNLPALLRFKFLNEYGYDKGAVAVAAIVADVCQTIERYYRRGGDLAPGEMIYPAPAATDRGGRGRSIANTKLIPVRLTVVADEDLEAMRAGLHPRKRREIRVRRLANEAHRQGALLSQADLGLLLGCSSYTVSNIARDRRQAGEFLPLRGYLTDMGSVPTHKAAIVRLYLEGALTPDIARRTQHSKEAVDRYIRGFERVRLLASRFAWDELPLLTGMSKSLVDQYLALIEQHRPLPERIEPHAAISS